MAPCSSESPPGNLSTRREPSEYPWRADAHQKNKDAVPLVLSLQRERKARGPTKTSFFTGLSLPGTH